MFALLIQKVYAARATEESDEEYEEGDCDDEEIETDEEEEEKKGASKGRGGMSGIEAAEGIEDDEDSELDDSDDEDYDEYDRTLLENYNSCIDENDEIDEFVVFKDTLQGNLVCSCGNSCCWFGMEMGVFFIGGGGGIG